MKSTMLFNFIVDKEAKLVKVERSFDAGLDQVWAAWTEKEILDQWWAPAPWKSRTKVMEFKTGGRRLYAMVGPNGEEHWALADFAAILPKKNFKYRDAFCDPEGNFFPDFPRSEWDVRFSPMEETTLVSIHIQHQSLADLEKIIEMGFREGFTIALEGLDKILSAAK